MADIVPPKPYEEHVQLIQIDGMLYASLGDIHVYAHSGCCPLVGGLPGSAPPHSRTKAAVLRKLADMFDPPKEAS